MAACGGGVSSGPSRPAARATGPRPGPAIARRPADLAARPGSSSRPLAQRISTRANPTPSDWEQVDQRAAGRPRRRYYQLTGEGAARAEQALATTVELLSPRPGLADRPAPRPGWGREPVTVVILAVTLVLVPMLLTEFTDWLPWIATRLVERAAAQLPAERRARYAEEWAAEFSALREGN